MKTTGVQCSTVLAQGTRAQDFDPKWPLYWYIELKDGIKQLPGDQYGAPENTKRMFARSLFCGIDDSSDDEALALSHSLYCPGASAEWHIMVQNIRDEEFGEEEPEICVIEARMAQMTQ